MAELTEDQKIASTILMQLGGHGRLGVMIGAKFFLAVERGLSFQFKRSRHFNAVRIKLNAMDLYDVELFKIRGTSIAKTEKIEGLYADQLKSVMEAKTGLALSL